MTDQARKRGRPLGSGKNDDPTLMQVAHHMIRDAALKPTTAMWRVLATRKYWPETDATLLRRLQVKWRICGEALLARARRELEPHPKPTPAEVVTSLSSCFPFAQPPVWASDLAKLSEVTPAFDRMMKAFATSPEIVEAMTTVRGISKIFHDAGISEDLRDLAKIAVPLDHLHGQLFRSPAYIELAAQCARTNANLARFAQSLPQLSLAGHASAI